MTTVAGMRVSRDEGTRFRQLDGTLPQSDLIRRPTILFIKQEIADCQVQRNSAALHRHKNCRVYIDR